MAGAGSDYHTARGLWKGSNAVDGGLTVKIAVFADVAAALIRSEEKAYQRLDGTDGNS